MSVATRVGPFITGETAPCEVCLEPVWERTPDNKTRYLAGEHDVASDAGPTVWPCAHYFHAGCSRAWRREPCPVCRVKCNWPGLWQALLRGDQAVAVRMAPRVVELDPECLVHAAVGGRAAALVAALPTPLPLGVTPEIVTGAVWEAVCRMGHRGEGEDITERARIAREDVCALARLPGIQPNKEFDLPHDEHLEFPANLVLKGGPPQSATPLGMAVLTLYNQRMRASFDLNQRGVLASLAAIPGTSDLGYDDHNCVLPLLIAAQLPAPLFSIVAAVPGLDPDESSEGLTALGCIVQEPDVAQVEAKVQALLLRRPGLRPALDMARSQLAKGNWDDTDAGARVVAALEAAQAARHRAVARNLHAEGWVTRPAAS